MAGSDQDPHAVKQFVADVAGRINRQRWWTALIWALAIGAGALVAVEVFYVWRGYSVPGQWIAICLAGAVFGAVVAWAVRRLRTDAAAKFADEHFGLKDAVTSNLHFAESGRQGGYYALQAQQTEGRVAPLKAASISYEPPRRGIVLAASLIAVAIPLSLKGPSEEVQEQMRIAEFTAEATTAINEDLAEMVEQLREETIDPEERELVDPDKLRRWVDELEATEDHKEALRQYAQLERKLNEARLAVQRKREEQLLDRAAKELEKGRETAKLGEKLEQKKYEEASGALEKMNPQETKSLEKWRRDLARLKAASQRMAAAARAAEKAGKSSPSQSQGKASASKSNRRSSQKSKAGKPSLGSSGASSGSGGELAQTIEELAEDVESLDEALEEAARQSDNLAECDQDNQAECRACQQGVSDSLNKLKKRLKKLSMSRKAAKKLSKLCKKCSECQGGLCAGMCMSPGAQRGGLKAGWGSDSTRRNETDELIDNGQTTQLKGIKGAGPSLTTVEAADDGSGVSTRASGSRSRQFERQLESFVAREDVPDQVKDGVKRYFEIIHQIESPEDSSSENLSTPGKPSE